MKASFPFDDQTFSINDSAEAILAVRQLLDGHHPGILSTVDAFGTPHMRWMASLSLHAFPHIFALTSAKSRKVQEIENHPSVTWMLFNHDLSLIVNLTGHATITEDPHIIKRVWRTVDDQTRTDFLDHYLSGSSIAVLQTRVENVECSSPGNCVNFSLPPDMLAESSQEHASFEDFFVASPPAQTPPQAIETIRFSETEKHATDIKLPTL